MKNNHIYYDDVSKDNVAVAFVMRLYREFSNIYPLSTIDLSN